MRARLRLANNELTWNIPIGAPAPVRLTTEARRRALVPRQEGTLMSIIGWLILGGIAGFIASMIIDRSGKGLMLDIILGVVGAVIGGFVFSLLGAAPVTGFNLYSMFVAVVGAVIVLGIYHAVVGRGRTI